MHKDYFNVVFLFFFQKIHFMLFFWLFSISNFDCISIFTIWYSVKYLWNINWEVLSMVKLGKTWPPFMYGVQQPQGYRATSRKQFTFYHQVPRNPWYSFYWPLRDVKLSWSWSHPVYFCNTAPGLGKMHLLQNFDCS